MKWNIIGFMKLAVLLLLLLFFSSCGVARRTKTITETKTVIQIDTLITVRIDTVTIKAVTSSVDTVYLENKVAAARSYINKVTGKLTLELKGKPHDVPVKINQTTVEKKKEIVTEIPILKIIFWLFMFLILLILIAFILYKIK